MYPNPVKNITLSADEDLIEQARQVAKNLAFIHLVPSEAAAGVDMAKPPHEGVHFLRVPGLGGELQQPLTKSGIQTQIQKVSPEPLDSIDSR
jgi:hypothetical protein